MAQGSPAEKAGLCAHSDYVIGTPYGIMRGEGDLYDLVEDNIGEPLRLHVYNSETDHVREASLIIATFFSRSMTSINRLQPRRHTRADSSVLLILDCHHTK